MSAEIQNVSDTALWVAVYRALETERPDALFRDPQAAILAGERGREIAANMEWGPTMGWMMAIRTVAIDRLILHAVERGVDVVVNLGAGLDTRPYRMSTLPASLRWIEVDFPHIVELKNAKLAGEKPVCGLERVALDLSNRTLRAEFFARLTSESKSIAVITEGVLVYLEPEAVRELAQDLWKQPNIRYWIQDFSQGSHIRRVRRSWTEKLKLAPFRFTTDDWFGFFAPLGWAPDEIIHAIEESERLKRRPPFDFPRSLGWMLRYLFSSPTRRENIRKMMGYVRMERKDSID